MKTLKHIRQLFLAFTLLTLMQCDSPLEQEVYGVLAATDEPASKELMEGLLEGVFVQFQFNGEQGRNHIYFAEFSSDHLYNERGGLFRQTSGVINWDWDASHPWFRDNFWGKPYRAIANANLYLEIVETSELSEEEKKLGVAEVRFARAASYSLLYNLFGAVPLRTSSDDEVYMTRATEEEITNFIESEFKAIAGDLPLVAAQFGKPTRGAAYGLLMRHYLHTKNWNEVINYADLIDGLGVYSLFQTGTNPYRNLFRVENESVEKETIFSFPASTLDLSNANAIMSHSYPEGDYEILVTGEEDTRWSPGRISGTKNRAYDFFIDLFEDGDDRKKQLISTYINYLNETVVQPANKNGIFKYWPDPNANRWASGHDFRIVRYADVLLSKAEALNELNGPTQQAIDLINEVRVRAKATPLVIGDFGSTEALRDEILDERGREFYFEGKRREDLIRHGKYVSAKRDHPVQPKTGAEDFRVLIPIPQAELDANPNMVQNPGY